MTPRTGLRRAGTAALLITWGVVVLALFGVGALAFKRAPEPTAVGAAAEPGARQATHEGRPVARTRPGSVTVRFSQRGAAHTPGRRPAVVASGQSTELHLPGHSPDVPATLVPRAGYLPDGLTGLPVDVPDRIVRARAGVTAQGRSPPAARYGI